MTKQQQQLVTDLVAKYSRPYRLLRACYPHTYRRAIDIGATIDEIDAECLYAACLAATTYRSDKGCQFSKYAAWRMRAQVARSTYQNALHPRRDVRRTVSGDIENNWNETIWDRTEDARSSELSRSELASKEIAADIDEVLKVVDRRKAEIFKHRRGFGVGYVRTYQETADVYQVSWQAIRLIELSVIERIKPALEKLYLKHILN